MKQVTADTCSRGCQRQFTYLEAMVDGCTARKLAPHSAAAARASIVLPVPGGPNSSTPLAGLQHAAS